MLTSWEIAKKHQHDASGIDKPEEWLWKKLPSNKIFYPIKHKTNKIMTKEDIKQEVSSMDHDEKMEYLKQIFSNIENLNCASRHSSDIDGGYNAIVLISNGK